MVLYDCLWRILVKLGCSTAFSTLCSSRELELCEQVLFTFNFCERICGGATFDLEPQSEELLGHKYFKAACSGRHAQHHLARMQLDVMAQYNKYRPLPSK